MILIISKNKKAISAWISWVLLIAFAAALSALMYQFMLSYTKDSAEDVKRTVYNTDECRLVSVQIDSACSSAQVLNITLQNNNYIRVDQIDIRVYEGRVPLHTNETNISLNPNRLKIIEVDVGTSSVTRVDVIPHVTKNNMDIICADKQASKTVTSC